MSHVDELALAVDAARKRAHAAARKAIGGDMPGLKSMVVDTSRTINEARLAAIELLLCSLCAAASTAESTDAETLDPACEAARTPAASAPAR